MNLISETKDIKINENEDYTCKDLSYMNFKDIDFSLYNPISFFRSDFRGSRFENIIFKNTILDRADFIAEYSCAITPQVRQAGNRLSGLTETAYASLLA